MLSDKGGRVKKNREEIGVGAIFNFSRGFTARAPRWTKPPCYAGYAAAESQAKEYS